MRVLHTWAQGSAPNCVRGGVPFGVPNTQGGGPSTRYGMSARQIMKERRRLGTSHSNGKGCASKILYNGLGRKSVRVCVCACVRVRAGACARARARVCACACVCLHPCGTNKRTTNEYLLTHNWGRADGSNANRQSCACNTCKSRRRLEEQQQQRQQQLF